MLPFRRFKDDANVLDQCVTMIEDTIHDIEEYLTFLACKPGISMPGLHALFFVDYSRYMVSY